MMTAIEDADYDLTAEEKMGLVQCISVARKIENRINIVPNLAFYHGRLKRIYGPGGWEEHL